MPKSRAANAGPSALRHTVRSSVTRFPVSIGLSYRRGIVYAHQRWGCAPQLEVTTAINGRHWCTPSSQVGAIVTEEHRRLEEARTGVPWRRWGPYLSERQWGTVREDDSESGDAWGSFPHDEARSRAYRWGEDGLAGISDDRQRLCFALALWNGRDPILKERLFGLTGPEGNHGED